MNLSARLPEAKRGILTALKARGSATIGELAKDLSITREGVRQALRMMTSEGWVLESADPPKKAGRPAHRFRLTAAGEHLFPKAYDQLSLELVDRLGEKGLKHVLEDMTDSRVRAWEPLVKGKSLPARLEILKDLYSKDDPFMSVEGKGDDIRLVERNCPFMNVASQRPALCSMTVSVLSRLTGHQVERINSFQAGHGRCEFRVRRDRPVDSGFRFAFEDSSPKA